MGRYIMRASKALMGFVLLGLCGVVMAENPASTATTPIPSDFKRMYVGLQGGLVILSGPTTDSDAQDWGNLTNNGVNVQGVLGLMLGRSIGMDFKVGYSKNDYNSELNIPGSAYVGMTTFSLNAKYVFRANNANAKTHPYLGLGFGSADENDSVSTTDTSDSFETHGIAGIIFVGVDYNISDNVSVLAEYTCYAPSSPDIGDIFGYSHKMPQLNLFNLGVHYHF